MGKKLKGIIYDICGALILVCIVFLTIFACSSSTREYINRQIDSFINDTVDTTTVVTPKDTVIPTHECIHDTVFLETEIHSNIHAFQDTIRLEKNAHSSLMFFTAIVNTIPIKFTLDTGCSNITISENVFNFLCEQELLAVKDIGSPTEVILANGDTCEARMITFKTITIGKTTLNNVEGMVIYGHDGASLFGQEILDKLGDVTIKHKQKILIIERD